MFVSVAEVETYLEQFISKSRQTTGKDVTVERMWPLLDRVGNPHENLKVVHVAGTSGKTSTVYYISNLLHASGLDVGSTVSPHVYSLTERLQINGKPVSDKEFCELFNQFIGSMGVDFDASYFELLIVFIFWAFDKMGVDYAVVETGLGGLHDGTNVCRREDKICVITDIGFDHQHVLGMTLSEIAAQKAGIIHKGNQVFMYRQGSDVMDQIQQRVVKVGADLQLIHPEALDNSTLPLFQQRNWQLANATYNFVSKRDRLEKLSEQKSVETQVEVPGRMQFLQVGNMEIVLDGAHNEQKMKAFVKSFRNKYPDSKVPVLLAMKQDKDYTKAVDELKNIASVVYCCGFSASQDMHITSVDPEVLIKACKQAGIQDAHIVSSIKDGVEHLLISKQKLAVITGSFYMLGLALQALVEEK